MINPFHYGTRSVLGLRRSGGTLECFIKVTHITPELDIVGIKTRPDSDTQVGQQTGCAK